MIRWGRVGMGGSRNGVDGGEISILVRFNLVSRFR